MLGTSMGLISKSQVILISTIKSFQKENLLLAFKVSREIKSKLEALRSDHSFVQPNIHN